MLGLCNNLYQRHKAATYVHVCFFERVHGEVSPCEIKIYRQAVVITRLSPYSKLIKKSVIVVCLLFPLYSHIFKYLSHFSNFIKSIEIFYEFDVCFHTLRQSNCLCLLTVQTRQALAGPLIHQQQPVYWIFTQFGRNSNVQNSLAIRSR